jgi:hypothetical protein
MANAILCHNDLLTDSAVTFRHSTEVSGYEAENVQIYQPGVAYRTSTVAAGYIQADSIYSPCDTFAALYTNVTRHRNSLKNSNELDEADWTTQNLGVAVNSSNYCVAGAPQSWTLTDDATSGQHDIRQALNVPENAGHVDWESDYWTIAFYVAQGTGDIDARLRLEASSGYYLQCSFDLSAGTAGSVSEDGSGRWENGSASITAVDPLFGSKSWYRIVLSGEYTSATATSDPTARLMLESGGSVSYSGSSDSILAHCATGENGASASAWVETTTGHAAFFKVEEYTPVTDGGTIVGWQHAAQTDMTGWDYMHLVAHLSAPYSVSPAVRLTIYDPQNADGYIEMGNYIVANSFKPNTNAATYSIRWNEEGDSSRSIGGQLYRPRNSTNRVLAMEHQFLTEAEAMTEALDLQRRVGRSRGVLASVDPVGSYVHRQTLWGLLNQTQDIVRRAYSTTLGGNVYSTTWEVIEALP